MYRGGGKILFEWKKDNKLGEQTISCVNKAVP